MMQTLLNFLSHPTLSLGDACKMVSANPRQVTVWIQRSGLEMPVPTGRLISERSRLFSGAETLQLAVMTRLYEFTDARNAAIWAENAVIGMKHEDALARPFSAEAIRDLGDIGLFVYSSLNREVRDPKVRTTTGAPELRSIKDKFAGAISLRDHGHGPQSFVFVPVGALLQSIIVQLAPACPDTAEAAEALAAQQGPGI